MIGRTQAAEEFPAGVREMLLLASEPWADPRIFSEALLRALWPWRGSIRRMLRERL